MGKRKCRYCGSTRHIENDHVKPRSKGGKATVPACRSCNRSKSNLSLQKWLTNMKLTNPSRYYRIKRYSSQRKTPLNGRIKKYTNRR